MIAFSFSTNFNTLSFLFFTHFTSIIDACCIVSWNFQKLALKHARFFYWPLSVHFNSGSIISSNRYIIQVLFSVAPCRMADMCLGLEVKQPYDTRSGRHFHSTRSLVLTNNHFSLYFYEEPSNTFIAFWDTLTRHHIYTKSAVAGTPLSRGTFPDDISPYDYISSPVRLLLLSAFSENNMLVRIWPAYVHCI